MGLHEDQATGVKKGESRPHTYLECSGSVHIHASVRYALVLVDERGGNRLATGLPAAEGPDPQRGRRRSVSCCQEGYRLFQLFLSLASRTFSKVGK